MAKPGTLPSSWRTSDQYPKEIARLLRRHFGAGNASALLVDTVTSLGTVEARWYVVKFLSQRDAHFIDPATGQRVERNPAKRALQVICSGKTLDEIRWRLDGGHYISVGGYAPVRTERGWSGFKSPGGLVISELPQPPAPSPDAA